MIFRLKSIFHSLLASMLVCVTVDRDVSAAEFFVSTTGNDTNLGTQEKPFATLVRARDSVRQLIKQGLHDDVVVNIREGIYRVAEPIVFGPQDSGTDKFKIIYAAFPGESPVISGGQVISNWEVNDDGTWQTILPEVASGKWHFRELFVNSERRPRCRHPNEGYLRVKKVVDDRRSFQFGEGEIPAIDQPGETELVLLHDWSISRNRVKSIDAATRTLETVREIGGKLPFSCINGFEPHPRYRLENHRLFLDAPGEWRLDRPSGVLRYHSLPGEQPADVQVVAPVATQLLVVRGKVAQGDTADGASVRNLHFRGLSFMHCRWSFDQGRYGGVQAGFHWSGPKSAKELSDLPRAWNAITPAVMFEFAESCSIQGSVISHVGGSGIWFHRGCRNNAIVGCQIHDVAANGIMLGDYALPKNRVITGQNEIRNNLIDRCGAEFTGAVGVWVGFSDGNSIAHNEVRNLPYSGVSVGWQWNATPTPCKANLVEYNHIHHVMQALSDGGGIYTLGLQPGTVLRGNWIHDIPANAGAAESNGMFLDQGTTDMVIEGNVIHDVACASLRFHQAATNVVRDNLLIHAQDVPAVRYNSTDPANIQLQDNHELETVPKSQQPFATLFSERCHRAGLEKDYQAKLLGDSSPSDQSKE